jgi:hypothetical protein
MEYARLYNETIPDLIPAYIEENNDTLDANNIKKHVDYMFNYDLMSLNRNLITQNCIFS